MSTNSIKFSKSIIVQTEDTLTPAKVELTPGGTANTKTTILGSQTTDRTITLPNVTDTLMGKTTADVMTNKSYDADGTGNVLTNVDDGNIKTGANIARAKLAVGTANIVPVNNGSGVLTDSTVTTTELTKLSGLVGAITTDTNTQNLTNKSISGSTSTITNVSLSGGVAGTLPVGNGGTGVNTITGYVKGTGTAALGGVATIPGSDITGNIAGNAANVTGTVAITNGGTGQTSKAPAFDALSPMTTGGDLIYGGTSGTGTRLANGSSGQVLTSNGTTTPPSWQTVNTSSTKNYIINGDMRISQRATSFAAVADGAYTLDRYQYGRAGAAVHTITQDTDTPTFAQAQYQFQNSLRMNLTTPDTAIAAGDVVFIQQQIEGFNFTNLAQKAFTLSFWVKATTTGIYCVSFRNSGQDRSYVAEYTINTTATWEYKTITVSASPTAGTWNFTNGVGLGVVFTLAAGTTFQTTAGTWNTGNFVATANQVNGVNTGSTDFRITGVMINEGSIAASFQTFARDINGEIAACERYFELISYIGGMSGQSATVVDANITFKTLKRSTVSAITLVSGTSLSILNATDNISQSPFGVGINTSGPTGAQVQFTGYTGVTLNRIYRTNPAASGATLGFSSEL